MLTNDCSEVKCAVKFDAKPKCPNDSQFLPEPPQSLADCCTETGKCVCDKSVMMNFVVSSGKEGMRKLRGSVQRYVYELSRIGNRFVDACA